MLTDQELQSLRNLGNEAEAAADEIVRLRTDLKATESLALKAQAYADERLAAAVAAERERCGQAYGSREVAMTAEIGRLRAELADALHSMRAYARDNPRHEYQGTTQDPNGVHAWLARNDRA